MLLHTRHIKLKMNALESHKHAHGDSENSAFPRENSLIEAPLLRLNNPKQWRKQKTHKTMGGAALAANQRPRRRREILLWKKRLTMYERTGFFDFSFRRCLVCEVRSETCIFSSFTNIEALTRNVEIVRIYCFLKKSIFFLPKKP